jgi:hypothetical protein
LNIRFVYYTIENQLFAIFRNLFPNNITVVVWFCPFGWLHLQYPELIQLNPEHMKAFIMKAITILVVLFSLAGVVKSQQVIITDDASYTTPASAAMLDVKSTTMGFMPPRVALTASNAAAPLTSPSTGLLVYNTATTSLGTVYDVTPGFYYNAGTPASPDWVQVMNSTGVGTAIAWDDLRVPLAEPSTGTVKPDWQKFPYGTSGDASFLNWFRASGIDEMYFLIQMPHDWKEGTAIKPHIHWVASQNGATGPTVPRWGLQYAWLNIGETFSSYTTIYGTATVPNEVLVKDRQYLTPLGSTDGIDGTGKTLSSMLVCRIFRDGDNAADTYAGLAGALEFDVHYQRNALGSRLEYVK